MYGGLTHKISYKTNKSNKNFRNGWKLDIQLILSASSEGIESNLCILGIELVISKPKL